ncbi:MAG TPA: hypothetical protein VGL72_17925 [Bryobacteraceae bacterium]|jgi:hypothetical protein
MASGKILLEGREVSLAELESALKTAKLDGATIHYYQENPAGEPPAEWMAVMKLIADNRLRIALTPLAESSESAPRPSNVLEFPGTESFFSKVRRKTAGSRSVSLVRSELTHFILPAPPAGTISEQMVAGVKAVLNSDQPRNIGAIAAADALAGDPSKPPTLPDVARHVPFFGLLMGLAYLGHAVWIFEAVASLLADGCEEADLLLVDSNAIATLPSGWSETVSGVMRNPNILIYDRNRQKIGAMCTAGEVPGRIEFPN